MSRWDRRIKGIGPALVALAALMVIAAVVWGVVVLVIRLIGMIWT